MGLCSITLPNTLTAWGISELGVHLVYTLWMLGFNSGLQLTVRGKVMRNQLVNFFTFILLFLCGWFGLTGCAPELSRSHIERVSHDQILLQPGIISEEMIYRDNLFPMCHSSTIAEAGDSLVCAWFSGSHEGWSDVKIWSSRKTKNNKWSEPQMIADGMGDDGNPLPCWNPVLYQSPQGPLWLFYKVGKSPRHWWGMRKYSTDGGQTWSEGQPLPDNILGPIRTKPLLLWNGSLLCPSSTEASGLRILSRGWRVVMETTTLDGLHWTSSGPLNGHTFDAIQPTILQHADNSLQILCRSREGIITQVWSHDLGNTWGEMTETTLPNPNSSIDAVTLHDGRQLLVYNHITSGRDFLNVALSNDGVQWHPSLILADQPGEFSYPAVIQSADGLVHITYSWQRRHICHVVLDPKKLTMQQFNDGKWPE